MEKKCTKCKEVKSLDEFTNDKKGNHGKLHDVKTVIKNINKIIKKKLRNIIKNIIKNIEKKIKKKLRNIIKNIIKNINNIIKKKLRNIIKNIIKITKKNYLIFRKYIVKTKRNLLVIIKKDTILKISII